MLVSDSNTFLALAISICSFIYFKNLKIGYSKLINIIGGSTFGVLYVHANSDTMITWLWRNLLNVSDVYGLTFQKLILFSGCSVAGIFIVCIVIDVIRKRVVEIHFMNCIERTNIYLKLLQRFS